MSYSIEPRFPFPSYKMVLENVPGSCNLLAGNCELFRTWQFHYPEPFVVEVVASFLLDCTNCAFLDIGANIGYYSSLALSLGARVTTVEPQLALFTAFEETTCINGWSDRATRHYGLLGLLKETSHVRNFSGGWSIATPTGRGNPSTDTPVVPFRTLFDQITCYDLIKLDVDSIEPEILQDLAMLMQRGDICVKTVVVELAATARSAIALMRYFELGYTILKLNAHIDQRFFDRYGTDIYSFFRPLKLKKYFKEVFFVRQIRYALLLQNVTSASEMLDAMKSQHHADVPYGVAGSFVITNQQLFWPQVEHSTSIHFPSAERQASGINNTTHIH